MSFQIFQVDAFTDQPFSGNPAAVCILTKQVEDSWMQAMAQEMNLAETAFLLEKEDGFHLRWFTPAVEVNLCGHATLASAHILWETGLLSLEKQARFHTRSGLLTADRKEKDIELNFPTTPVKSAEAPNGLKEALNIDFKYVGKSKYDYLVEVED